MPDSRDLGGLIAELASVDGAGVADEERVDLIRVLEDLKAGAAAAQARLSVAFDESQRAEQAAAGVPTARQGRGVAVQIAAARRESPHRGSRSLGFAKALVQEMPHALAMLTAGLLSEWRATMLVRETACLSVEDRAVVDRTLCADPTRLDGLGDRQVRAEAVKLACRLDPASVVRRRARAESERRVSIRPMPDTMTQVSGLVPLVQGVACHAALTRTADALIAAGDPRSRGQIMADTFVARLTGQATASGVPVSVQLVMTDRALLGVDDTPATVPGHGPLPAWLARRTVAHAAGAATGTATRTAAAATAAAAAADTSTGAGAAADAESAQAVGSWLRRLYTDPTSGQLVAMDSKARCFPEGLAAFIDLRDDGVCRTPWCDAPIRHHDHVLGVVRGGVTSGDNGQGLCQQCNHAKQAPGWHARPRPGPGRHEVETTTPTGHTYRSTARPLPGADAARAARTPMHSRLEAVLARVLLAG